MTRDTTRTSHRGLTLAEAAAQFWRYPSPWLLTAALVGAVAARLAVGDWRTSDAVVPLAIAFVFPFAEWVIHVVVLHWRPRRVAGVTVDSLLARKHREHHVDPRDIPLVFIPLPSLIGAIVSATAVALLAFPRTGLGLTFLAVVMAVGLAYEWTHYLVHTDYKPQGALYRFIWRNHRLHHFKNEHFWYAVTTPGTADRVLGTFPEPTSVPTSPTAKNLHSRL
ncbi:MAG: fatty acid hydroxylase family protein [Mycobacteriaceae bacterium]|nr:fatty acid hydroxylase family protein [Mycobacteriaceae bacterium]